MFLNYGFLAVLLFGIWYNGSFPYFYRKYLAKRLGKQLNKEYSYNK